jgi:serine/threonine protein phosphatase PrpC
MANAATSIDAVQNWTIVGCSVRGAGHERDGRPCQDVHGFHDVEIRSPAIGGVASSAEQRLQIIAVADGAGSARFAEEGAKVAVDAASTELRRALEESAGDWASAIEPTLRGALRAARSAVDLVATERGASAGDFACTLILTVLGTRSIAGIQIGDGGVVVSTAADHSVCVTASAPQKSEYFNEVCFLTSSAYESEARVFFRNLESDPVCAVAVFSDGIELIGLNVSNYEPHVPFFRPVFSFVAASDDRSTATNELAAFLASPRVCDRTDDDKTVVIAVPRAVVA